MSEMRFPADAVLHFPSLAGVKFGGVDDPGAAEYANRIYLASGPLVVIERDQKFTAITWSPWDARIGKDHPGVSRAGDAWLLKFPAGADVRPFPAESSLDAAVAHYRAEHLSSDDVRGRAVLDRVRRCVLLDMQLVDGRIAHNFSDATRLLRDLEKLDLARGALLYLPGWHGPYDSNMPKWTPADALGGRDGFAELVRVSKDLGAIVFPHFNYWGYDPATNLLGENWKELWTGEGWSGNSGYFK